MRVSNILKIFLSAILLVLSAASYVMAQDDDDDDSANLYEQFVAEVNKKSLNRANVDIRLKPLGYGLMGDNVDSYSGRLSFSVTDVSLPGNSNLPVKITRTARSADATNSQEFFMADWDIEVPSLNRVGGSNVHDITRDWKLDIPGRGSEVLYGNGIDPHDGAPGLPIFDEPRWGGQDIRRTTERHTINVDGNYVTSDGTTYVMGHRIFRSAGDKFIHTDMTRNLSGGGISVRRLDIRYATEVIDVNGNWVKYEYDGDYLSRIHSNDGREITLDYIVADGTKYVSKVTANGRVWTYEYQTVVDTDRRDQDTRKLLHKVIQPDGKYWEYDLNRLVQDEPSTISDWHGPYTNGNTSISVKHPYGTQATYQLGHVVLDRTDRVHPYDHSKTIGYWWEKSIAVYSKTLTLSNGETLTWEYDYKHRFFENEFETIADNNGARILTKPNGTRVQSSYTSSGYLGHQYTYEAENDILLKRIINEYISPSYPFGSANINTDNEEEEYDEMEIQLLSKQTIFQDGATYTTEHSYDTDPYSLTYSYNKPIETKTYSDIPGSTIPRVSEREYKHLKDKWVVGLLEKASINDREIAAFEYDSYGQVIKDYRYGQLNMTYGYYPRNGNDLSGSLNWKEDTHEDPQKRRRTTVTAWKRGTAQAIEHPDETGIYRQVDDNGWLTSQTDNKGITTSYEYNDVGWLTWIRPHHNTYPTITRLPTQIRYFHTPTYMTQFIDRGYERELVRYDSLHRPFEEINFERIQASYSHVTTQYDALGRVSFKSFPSDHQNFLEGTNFTYDALGRMKSSVETVGEGATILYDYLSDNRTVVTDAEGHSTTTWRNGYDGPSGGGVIKIEQPEDTTTLINRNIFNEIESVTQFGAHNGYNVSQTQTFTYDDRRRLCRHYTPETGSTLYGYNDADEITSHARVVGNGNSCVAPSGDTLVNLTYDPVGRPKNTLFADPNTKDIFRKYDDDGNLVELTRGVSTEDNWVRHFYDYDDYNDLAGERLIIREVAGDGNSQRIFDIDYYRDVYGHLRAKRLPSGRILPYKTDSRGRVMRVGYINNPIVHGGASNFGVQYHPTGDIAEMFYGNGQSLTQTLNERRQIDKIKADNILDGGNITAVDLSYVYDLNGRITDQIDGVNAAHTRAYTYDGQGRLRTASSDAFGTNGNFKYDSLGNIRRKVMNRRIVTMEYNGNNRLISANDTRSGLRTLSYDIRGNVTKLGNLNFIYDMANQPRTVYGQNTDGEDIGGQNDNYYAYDGNMKRVKSVTDGRTIFNVYDAMGKLVHVESGDDPDTPEVEYDETDYVHANGMTVARIKNGVTTYLHPDHLGSAQSGTTQTGTVDWREHYTPFGETLVNDAANDNQAGFTGHIKDAETGLNYMQARYYDPVIGRFLSNDPISFLDTGKPSYINRYRYCSNDPINCIDPTGMADGPIEELLEDESCSCSSLGDLVSDVIGGIINAVANESSEGSTSAGEEENEINPGPLETRPDGKIEGDDLPEVKDFGPSELEAAAKQLEKSAKIRNDENAEKGPGRAGGNPEERAKHERFIGHADRANRETVLANKLRTEHRLNKILGR